MRIPTVKLEFKDLGYDDYWVRVPRSVKEGFVYEMARLETEIEDAAEKLRRINTMVLSLVVEWNLDDEKGTVLPLISACKTDKDRFEVVAEIPVELVRKIVEVVTATGAVNERTKGF